MLAGAIGVAVIGSVLGTIYTSSFEKAITAVAGLPAMVIEAASDSVGAAVVVAQQLPAAAGDTLTQIARTSFMDGWQVMALISCIINIIGAILVIKFMPARHEPLEPNTDE